MIDPSSAPKISSMDASLAGSASLQRNDAKAANGFDDALSSAGHSGRNRQDRADAVSGGETEADAAPGVEAEGAETRATKGTRPAIDVSGAALSRPSIAGTVVGGAATAAAAAAAGRTTAAIAATTDTPAAATDAAQSRTGPQALGEDGWATDIAAARTAQGTMTAHWRTLPTGPRARHWTGPRWPRSCNMSRRRRATRPSGR